MSQFFRRAVVLLASAAVLAGCAVSSSSFYANRSKTSDLQLCKTARSQEAKKNPKFRSDVIAELRRRGVSDQECNKKIQAQRAAIAAGIAAGALAYAATQDSGSGYSGSGYSPTVDTDWDWDQFRDQYGNLVWACRGVQTGRFAESYRCQYDLKVDDRWPTKEMYF